MTVQYGYEYLIGCQGMYFQGYTPQSVTYTKDADVSAHEDCSGAIDNKMITNPRKVLSMTLDIPSTGSVDAFAKGAIVAVKGPTDSSAVGWFVESSSVSISKGIAQLSVSLVREDSMASYYDTYIAQFPLTFPTNLQ